MFLKEALILNIKTITTPAEKGLTLIWPTDFSHTHKGQITKQHEKYILTGWLGYI